MKHKVLSLFSGAGGLDTGLLMTGRYEVTLANDIKRFMVETYRKNFKMKTGTFIDPKNLPQAILNDVSVLDFESLKDKSIDIVVGGPPCQDFSVLRSSTTERSGITVRRGRLYAHFVRALVNLQPKAFLFENVPGIVSANGGEAYRVITKDFSHSRLRWEEVKKSLNTENSAESEIQGYNLLFNEVVNASDFGVPQARKRLIIVGLRKDLCKNQHPLFLSSEFKKHFREHKMVSKYPITCIEVFEGKPLPEIREKYAEIMREYNGICKDVGTPKASRWKRKAWGKLTFDTVEDYLGLNNIKNKDESELEKAFGEHKDILKELGYYGIKVSKLKTPDGSNNPPKESSDIVEKVRMIPPGENYNFVKSSPWQLREKGVSQIYRRLHPLKPSYTVVAFGGGGMAMYHYERQRSALTNREKARLQTFPDAFEFTGGYSSVKAQIGEAVPPLLAKRFAVALARLLDDLA